MEVVKRKGHKEEFDERKLYASVYAACIAVRCTDEQAENLASIAAHETKQHFSGHKESASSELRKVAAEILHRFNPEAAFIYESHKDIA